MQNKMDEFLFASLITVLICFLKDQWNMNSNKILEVKFNPEKCIYPGRKN